MLLERSIEIAEGLVKEFDATRQSSVAWEIFKTKILQIMSEDGVRDVMELGAGRAPSFERAVLENLGITYCSNDISQRELDLGPSWTNKAQFDLCAADPESSAQFAESADLVFSRMLMEHVPNYKAAYRNIFAILRPGGIGIAFHPVLFSVPFVANRLLPERLSASILKAVFPDRNDIDTPKFPASYSGCRISNAVRNRISAQGFRAVWQIPFWGHGYYRKFPIVRDLHEIASGWVQRRGMTTFATFAFTVVVK
jgi:SAM-dependent methyltransferase